MIAPVIVWFRRDLRLADNPALSAAASSGAPVVPVYVWEPPDGPWATGAASRWWLWHSLRELDRGLRDLGSRLVVAQGSAVPALARVAAASGAGRLYFSRTADPGESSATELRRALAAAGADLTVLSWPPDLLFGPPFPVASNGRPYQAFTPFWKACRAAGAPARPAAPPAALAAPATWPDSVDLGTLRDQAVRPWSQGFDAVWRPGERGGRERLAAFVRAAMADYAERRDRVDLDGTSRLSPHLHFGEVSVRTVWHAAREGSGAAAGSDGIEAFLRQLAWRDFAHHLLLEHPETTDSPLRKEFAAFPWDDDADALEAWRLGRTGYPIVDAGLRELWHTGWMHNRARLVCASLLCKHLLVRWQQGAHWFWETLVDADLADNSLGWQWVAGCGADAAPYFRVFNPVLQGRRHDPRGIYVRRWLPEIAGLPDECIHAPWEAPADVRRRAGVRLVDPQTAASLTAGRRGPAPLPEGAYPEPVIDHRVGRRRALAAFAATRQGG